MKCINHEHNNKLILLKNFGQIYCTCSRL